MQTTRWLLHASPCIFVLVSLLVIQSSHGARPSPGALQGRRPAATATAASRVGSPTEKQLVDTGIIAAGTGRDADVVAAPPSPLPALVMTTTPAGAVGDDRRSRGGDDVLLLPRRGIRSVALVMAQALRHSARAARRALVEAASSATDGAGPSCHSHDPHITCSPPLQN